MIRIDFLGVPGVGKSTVYNKLGEIRQRPSEFYLIEEAYKRALLQQLSPVTRFADQVGCTLDSRQMLIPLSRAIKLFIDNELSKFQYLFERNNNFEEIVDLWFNRPNFLLVRMDAVGKHHLQEQPVTPAEYIDYLLKTSYRVKQFNLIEESLPKKAKVVVDKSFTQMVFFAVDFSKRINIDFIKRYLKDMPVPGGVIIITASPDVIVKRIRYRAEKGWVGTLHRDIYDTEQLEKWVTKACDIVNYSRECLKELGINILDLDASDEPRPLAIKTQEFIRTLK